MAPIQFRVQFDLIVPNDDNFPSYLKDRFFNVITRPYRKTTETYQAWEVIFVADKDDYVSLLSPLFDYKDLDWVAHITDMMGSLTDYCGLKMRRNTRPKVLFRLNCVTSIIQLQHLFSQYFHLEDLILKPYLPAYCQNREVDKQGRQAALKELSVCQSYIESQDKFHLTHLGNIRINRPQYAIEFDIVPSRLSQQNNLNAWIRLLAATICATREGVILIDPSDNSTDRLSRFVDAITPYCYQRGYPTTGAIWALKKEVFKKTYAKPLSSVLV